MGLKSAFDRIFGEVFPTQSKNIIHVKSDLSHVNSDSTKHRKIEKIC